MLDRQTIYLEIMAFMQNAMRWFALDAPLNSRPDLLSLAARVLAYQRENHPVYARYCAHVSSERSPFPGFPPIPARSFKRADLSPFPQELTVATFRSSGTTEGSKSLHRFRDLGLMQRAIFGFFPYMTMHGVMSTNTHYYSLMPSHSEYSTSSLGYMLSEIVDLASFGESACFGRSDFSIDVEGFCSVLESVQEAKEWVHLMGPSFAYVQLLEALGDRTFKLPSGSRLLETGGYKGRVREVPKSELRAQLREVFGLEPGMIYAEYGMCELSSQFYELQPVCGIPLEMARENAFVAPPWCNFYILDPDTLEQVPSGELGQVAILDLANLDSAAFILTDDVGSAQLLSAAERERIPSKPYKCLQLQGRAPFAEPKGCSLAFDF